MKLQLERLTPHHPVHAFDCGTSPAGHAIGAFLREQALTEQAAGWSATTVAVDLDAQETKRQLAGFYTLAPLGLRADTAVLAALGLGGRYPQVGGYLLGRLGVAGHLQRRGLGALLVERAIDAASRARTVGGGAFLAVDAKTEALVAWYLGLDYGFFRLSPDRPRLVLRLPG
ncbi:MAG: hypothetical protein HY902_07775 [Deltaproteobacteria bacterium]|nr:hypothetical protein [Deltaproteobacteria bacterium]